MSIRWFVSGGGLRARAGVGESAVRFYLSFINACWDSQ